MRSDVGARASCPHAARSWVAGRLGAQRVQGETASYGRHNNRKSADIQIGRHIPYQPHPGQRRFHSLSVFVHSDPDPGRFEVLSDRLQCGDQFHELRFVAQLSFCGLAQLPGDLQQRRLLKGDPEHLALCSRHGAAGHVPVVEYCGLCSTGPFGDGSFSALRSICRWLLPSQPAHWSGAGSSIRRVDWQTRRWPPPACRLSVG